ncbi:MAG: phosphotransferase [Bacteroidetes bacterium]|nr:phosphotransferase [Bacteroidota bacterium]
MRLILQSPYLVYEYLYWRVTNNLSDNSTKELKANIEKLQISTLKGLSRNLVVQVLKDSKALYYLKQFGSTDTNSYIPNENRILQELKDQKFVVEIFFYDNDNQILATKAWGEKNLKNLLKEKGANTDALLELAVNVLVQIHTLNKVDLKIPKPKPYSLIKTDKPDDSTPILLQEDLEYLFCTKEWKSSVLLHFDPRDVNFLVKGDETKLIDWEMAIYGDPMWDLAVFINSIIFTLGGDLFFLFSNPSTLESVQKAISIICTKYQSGTIGMFDKEKLKKFLRLQNTQFYGSIYYKERTDSILP